ncbi:hypothetical protein M513_02018, partial [Trichuris suis]
AYAAQPINTYGCMSKSRSTESRRRNPERTKSRMSKSRTIKIPKTKLLRQKTGMEVGTWVSLLLERIICWETVSGDTGVHM